MMRYVKDYSVSAVIVKDLSRLGREYSYMGPPERACPLSPHEHSLHLPAGGQHGEERPVPVSYTHLDVYKRQLFGRQPE